MKRFTLFARFSEEAAKLVSLSRLSCKSSIFSLWLDSLLFLVLEMCILGDFGDLGWKKKNHISIIDKTKSYFTRYLKNLIWIWILVHIFKILNLLAVISYHLVLGNKEVKKGSISRHGFGQLLSWGNENIICVNSTL